MIISFIYVCSTLVMFVKMTLSVMIRYIWFLICVSNNFLLISCFQIREKFIEKYGPLNKDDEIFIKEQVASFDEAEDLKSEIDSNNFLGTTSTFGSYERRKNGGVDNSNQASTDEKNVEDS